MVSPEISTLRDALATYMELLHYRLAVQGAFVLLTDGDTPFFLAGTPGSQPSEKGESRAQSSESACWLGTDDTDLQQWLWIFRQTISVNTSSVSQKDKIFSILSLSEDDHSSNLSSVCRAPHLSSYAGTPMISKSGIAVGAVFVVDNAARKGFSIKDEELLMLTAEKCMDQLEFTRQSKVQDRWQTMNKQLSRFVESRSIRDQQLEEPSSFARTDQKRRRKEETEEVKALALRYGQDPSKAEDVAMPEDDFSKGAESNRLLQAEIETFEHVVKEDEENQARTTTAQAGKDDKRSDDQGETIYRKIFRRAAECLQEALQVDGVLFTDGLIGYHGSVQPMAEPEGELQHETVQKPHRERFPEETIGDDPFTLEDGSPQSDAPLRQQEHSSMAQGASSRTYTSAEYLKGVYIERPAEIFGMSTRNSGFAPKTKSLNSTTVGLATLDEARLQMLMDSYPNGNLWCIPDTMDTYYSSRNDSLVEDKPLEEVQGLIACFPGVRQLMFQPLTDPVSLKRLAGCLAWSTKSMPVFTDTTDLPSLRGFLHVLESEISRVDVSAAGKQKEAFVASVSHELRTPLHGILGSVQLLADTNLDPFQAGLADTIKTSGSTLNETLTSVLSYARINQFERQQNKYRQRRPPDADWSLPNKMQVSQGPDLDYKGLYVCTDFAMLCEEITSVLEAGQSYDRSTHRRNVTVVSKIQYEENWRYLTEPGALRRIAMNIIGNALKYTTEGSVIITLTASKTTPGGIEICGDNDSRRMVNFTVKDTGKGISEDFMDNHLFVPFTQEDTTSSHGVGLGMSIVKSLVSLLAGEIKVDSKLDEGTQIMITMPMKLCSSDLGKVEKPTIELQRRIASLRGENLSVLLFGFPSVVRLALEEYLREWFHCKLVENTDHTKPDVVLVEEGNDEVAGDVERTSQRYGRHGVLLSIVMGANALAKPMRPIKGYSKWERILRPMGPNNLGKALSACVVKSRELRRRGVNDEQDESNYEQNVHSKTDQPSREDDRSDKEDATRSLNGRSQAFELTDTPSATFPPASSEGSAIGPQGESSSTDPPNLDILVVEDNAVNRKLLGAFLKKCGYVNVRYAENGALAVEAVEGNPRCFDVIFMDLSMPVMNGFTATREIRRIEHSRRSAQSSSDPTITAHIVALTGLASDRDEDEALAVGVDIFITKPVQFNKLSKLLKVQEERALLGGHGESS